jgi:hypothetical protein
MSPEESLWLSQGHTEGLSSATFYEQLRQYLRKAGIAPAGVHFFVHTAAMLRRDAGESIGDGPASLEGQEDRGWGRVAEAIGV